jgi:hypothetical protein
MDFSTVLANQAAFDSAVAAKLSAIATSLSARAKTADLLDGNGKIKTDLLGFNPADQLTWKGTFDPATDSLDMLAATAVEGDIYAVSASGTLAAANAYTGITTVTSGDTLWFIDGSFRHLKTGGVAAATASAVILDSSINGFNGTTVFAILQEMAARIVKLESDTGDIGAALLAMGVEWASAATTITAIAIPA